MEYAANMPRTTAGKSLNLLATLEQLGAVRRLADVYSRLLEERVTPRQTLHLVHAQLACFALLLTASAPWAFYVLELAWTALAVKGCANALSHAHKR